MTLQPKSASNSDQQLEAVAEQALAGPGVLDMMLVYETAEEAYLAAMSATSVEPDIWVASSTSQTR